MNLVDSPATAKFLPSKYLTLHRTTSGVIFKPSKYYHPNASSSFIHQKLISPKFYAIWYSTKIFNPYKKCILKKVACATGVHCSVCFLQITEYAVT